MPRFFFDVHNRIGLIADEEGRELADVEVARAEALKGARSIIADEVLQGQLDLDGRIDVADADGSLLFSISFAEAAGTAKR